MILALIWSASELIMNLRVGQWLAILTVFVALGRCLYDAYLIEPARIDGLELMKISRLERKLAAMQNSDDKQAKDKIVDDLISSYIDTCQYAKAEPLVFRSLTAVSPGADAVKHAQALARCGDFYSHSLNIERAQICYLKARDIFLREKDFDGAANSYLSLTKIFQSQAEVSPPGPQRQANFTAAAKWLGEAMTVARQAKLSQASKAYLRNTYLLLLAAEGRVEDLAQDIAVEVAK